MLLAVLALQLILLVLLVVLLARKSGANTAADPRLSALPDAMIQLAAKLDASDAAMRNQVVELRREQAENATQARHAAEQTSRNLREEVSSSITTLSKAINEGITASRTENANAFGSFRTDNTEAANKLREAVTAELNRIGQRLETFFAEAAKQERESRVALNSALTELTANNTKNNETLRESLQQAFSSIRSEQREGGEALKKTVESGLRTLNTDNAAKLDEMRVIVDEKLQSTLNERLTASFGTVSDQLTKVHTGLGEMKELATGVSDLKRVFSNVKSRGVVGEFQLGMQLEQMFSRDQYLVNAKIKEGSGEAVEFALKIPEGDNNHVLLPIDAKFPREDWERLEWAYEHGTKEEQDKAGNAFERAIRTEGKRICDKYIDPPKTLPVGIMFLPTEALYAEVMRRPGLQAELQSQCRVTVAGPSSFMAILTSFQMGFRTLAIQQKGSEVWNVLANVKKEFGKFELLMDKVQNNVKTVQNTLGDIGTRTRQINRKLHDVSELPALETPPKSGLLSFEPAGVTPALFAADEDDS
ncbi:DNA recombination protein RmuC [Terriglobus roseus]|uniref:DNA recombination protein RmuC n=1 Tax=Terriglobus roseus TaxID=392734 RepID=A0A1G7QMF5_9BACT|nr:DNA recombination protein RmuC [Terriglobus roseus]SDF98800.1 DNA recombination protein RmuC [Terriglobus roseus]